MRGSASVLSLRSIRLAGGMVASVVTLAIALLYGVSEWRIRRSYDAPLVPLHPATAPDPVAGLHMAKVVGCWAGCHGNEGEGGIERIEGIRSNTAPTLSQVLPAYSDAELARLVRYGVKRDGRSAIGMASYTWWPLGDQDLANIFRAPAKPADASGGAARAPPHVPRAGSASRWVTGRSQRSRSTGRSRDGVSVRATRPSNAGATSRASSAPNAMGSTSKAMPSKAGPRSQFLQSTGPSSSGTCLHTGKPIGGRDIPKMSWMPEVDFTDREIDDLYVFLREYHGLPPPGAPAR